MGWPGRSTATSAVQPRLQPDVRARPPDAFISFMTDDRRQGHSFLFVQGLGAFTGTVLAQHLSILLVHRYLRRLARAPPRSFMCCACAPGVHVIPDTEDHFYLFSDTLCRQAEALRTCPVPSQL